MCCWIRNIYNLTDNSSCPSPIQRQAYVRDLEMFSILMKINAYEDNSGKKDGNLKALMLGLKIHISLTASKATFLSTIVFRMFQTLNESLIMQSTHDHIHA
jgi:hypothetical protein